MIKGFILAAGFSKRLRPITDYIPKPLLPIAGEILLDYVYNFLKSLEIDQIGINLHYKAKEIESYIINRALSIQIFNEEQILNTGGALYNAKKFLIDSIFIVHNADIYWDGNIKEAIKWHINSKNSITLLVHDYSSENKLLIDDEDNFLGIIDYKAKNCQRFFTSIQNKRLKAFTGIAIYSPEVLELLPKGASSVIDLWIKAKNSGLKVRAFHSKYTFWYDVGTPIGFACAVFDKLKRNFTSVFVHPSSSGCELINIMGNTVIERDVKIKKPFIAKNIIILPETEVSLETDQLMDSIICKNCIVSISGWQGEKENLSHGGSTRSYFRKKNKVFCLYKEINQDFDKTVILGKFLKQKGFPVADILDVKRQQKLIIFEDLGDLTLYSWLQCKRYREEILNVYKKIIDHVVTLHWKISLDASELQEILPEFDHTYFIWESDYFMRECVEGIFGVNLTEFSNDFIVSIKEEINYIAEKLSKSKKVILHRDLQSQNIMLKNGKIYFIDYQSARWGPAAYDIASLLWDPYIELSDEINQKLVNHYIDKSLSLSSFLNPTTFLEELSFCRIQRHMQALGAYGFLSLKRGKKNFLKFISPALKLLMQDIEESPIALTRLRELIIQLDRKLPYLNINLI